MTPAIWNEMLTFMAKGFRFEFSFNPLLDAHEFQVRYHMALTRQMWSVSRLIREDRWDFDWEGIKHQVAKSVADGTLVK